MNKSEIWKRAITVWKNESGAIKDLIKTVNKNELFSVVKVIAECNGRIITSGTGTSAVAAKKISHSLSCIERPSFFLSPSDAVHGALGSVQKDDIAILVSKGGNTAEMVGLIDPLKLKKVLIIAVTENNRSILAKKSDIFLKVSVKAEADDFNMLATTSTLTVISVFDAICVILMQYTGYTKRKFAVIHPGGAVGERLGKNGD
jgi:D-arabinose 5-phosphate isomerase GutQ